jgi:hypothetical protein
MKTNGRLAKAGRPCCFVADIAEPFPAHVGTLLNLELNLRVIPTIVAWGDR